MRTTNDDIILAFLMKGMKGTILLMKSTIGLHHNHDCIYNYPVIEPIPSNKESGWAVQSFISLIICIILPSLLYSVHHRNITIKVLYLLICIIYNRTVITTVCIHVVLPAPTNKSKIASSAPRK